MPHQRGYRHVSRRIPFALLPEQIAAVACPFFRAHRPLGATGLAHSAHRKFCEPCARFRWHAPFFVGSSGRAEAAKVRQPHISEMGAITKRRFAGSIKLHGIRCEHQEAHGSFVARYVYQLFSSRNRPRRPGSFGRGRISSGGSSVSPVVPSPTPPLLNAPPPKPTS